MVIIGRKAGRLGNRLFTFAHFIANAIEYKYQVFNPAFGEYQQYFLGTENQFLTLYPQGFDIRNNFIKKILRKIFQVIIYNITYLMVKKIIPWQRSRFHEVLAMQYPDAYQWWDSGFLKFVHKKLVICNGWIFWDHENFDKHADAIRKFFSLKYEHKVKVQAVIMNSRRDADVLIGVHIRQGDYARWLGGKYFYTFEQYARVIDEAEKLFPNKRVKFFISSNTKEVREFFKSGKFCFGSEHFIEDMYALSECDYIIGPPSSYSGWAAFYGNKKIYYIEDAAKDITLDDFKFFNSEEYFSH